MKKKVYAEVVAWHFVGFRFLDVKPFCFSECPHVFTMARPRPLKSKGDAFDVLHFFPHAAKPFLQASPWLRATLCPRIRHTCL